VRWLLACVAMVSLMTLIGGITRLTGSGLSMVQWRPVSGALPPLCPDDWEALFAEYRGTPQFRLENARMTLGGFKRIFWWEYIHRLAGRVTGAVFFAPLLILWRRGAISRALAPRLVLLGALGASQGLMGWLMVKSGLVHDPRVSPLRLALHLGLAFALAGLLLRTALALRDGFARPAPPRPLARLADALSAGVYLMALSGALVAGNHAGRAFNTWPLMMGRLVPAGLYAFDGVLTSSLHDVLTVQFHHRVLALALMVAVPAFCLRARHLPHARRVSDLTLGLFAAQIALGISTLLLAVPTTLAVLHQANALALFLSLVATSHALQRDRAMN
jgi:cytochrome c oxidase assembly protein subunit 15